MSSSAHHHATTSEPALRPPVTAALILIAAALLTDPLARTGRTTLLLAALHAPRFGHGLTQALAVYGPGSAHTAARLP